MYLQIYDTPADGLESAEGQLNAGGIRRLRLIQADQLQIIRPDRFPLPGLAGYPDYTLSDQHLIFGAGASLTEIEIIPAYADFKEDADSDSHGTFYKPAIQLLLPKIRPAVSIWIHRNQEVRWIAFIADRNGFFRCVGTPEQPLRLEISQGTGAGSGRNQTTLTISGRVQQPAYYLEGIEDADLINPLADFDESFSFDFNS
ncbi:hypothetical protein GCM10028803_05030 [Larkinella knui]|uniref:Uncharacterized protein n=1 Tax=Larkinella knui TaxID=2025310 RepID=A0A3P1CKU2_9BACT|nr:hypothetical protein [Larkinella knui]RRB13820.1 hypothetical protein EHT87_16305 [Larkinella knui]